jgi:carboxypeptidase C (cathepsin A)
MYVRQTLAALFAILPLLATPVMAQQQNDRTGIFSLLPGDSVTSHNLKTPTGDLPYTATAGSIDLHGQDGRVTAKVFYTAYVAKGEKTGRPLTFAFNGGPGAASAYLNLGLVGPRILEFGARGDGTTPVLGDNPQSWLGFTDLVLIDPVGTGWSRAAGTDATGFWGVKQDAETLAKVITLYTQRNDRLGSAKYLLGESYGGFRAAKVAMALKDSQGILVSGIIMLSPLIDGRLLFGATDYPLGAALQLPSLAAAELERRNAFSDKSVAEAEKFALGEYLTGLAGAPPTGKAADAFYARIADLTGIPEPDIARNNGFVGDIYTKRAATGQVVSPYDAAYLAPDPYPELTDDRSDDPILDGFTRAYGAAFANYARQELGFNCEITYTLLNTEVNRHWNWGDSRYSSNVTNDIRTLLAALPGFRLMIAHGYSDALTPFGSSRYVLDHLPASLAGQRTALKLYRGGHMFYTRADSRRAMSEDARKFFAGEMATD